MDPKEQREMLAEAYKFEKPCPEVNVTPEVRQEGYEAFVTTDDHTDASYRYYQRPERDQILYHQNSWGTERNYIWRLSEYVRKAMSRVPRLFFLMVHKDAIPAAIKQKLGIK